MHWYYIVPHRRGTWKMAYCLELQHRKQLQTASKLADSDRGNRQRKKALFAYPCWQSSREGEVVATKSLLQKSLLVMRHWRWGRINSWDTQSVWSWNTVASSLRCSSLSMTESSCLSFISLNSSSVFTAECLFFSLLSSLPFTLRASGLFYYSGSHACSFWLCSLVHRLSSLHLSLYGTVKCLKGWLLPLSSCSSAPLPFRWSRLRQKISWMICHALPFNRTVTLCLALCTNGQ